MERMERINSSYDLEYEYYRKNLPAIEDSEDTEESIDMYEQIFESRKTFTVLGLDSYIILNKKSLNKIASLINKYPQEYVLFTNHQEIEEDKLDKLLAKEEEDLNPIFIADPDEENNKEKGINLDVNEPELTILIDNNTFKLCLWLYLFLLLCSICNLLFLLYIAVKTKLGMIFFTICTFVLFLLLLFTGIYGYIKCKAYDFTACFLKFCTFSVPISGAIGIISFFVNSITFEVFWMKIIVDVITIIVGIIIIYYLNKFIEIKKYYGNDKKERLIIQ